MIDVNDIAKFPADVQARIRETVSQMLEKGHKLRHLTLAQNGMVRLDYEQIEMDADAQLFGQPGKPDR